MRSKLIFGREPAAWIGLIESILTLLMAFALGIGQDTFGPIMAVVTAVFAVYTAWATKATMLGVIVGLAKSVVTLLAVYGLTLTDGQTAALIGLVTIVFGFFNRTQTYPVADPPTPIPGSVPVTVVNNNG